MFSGLSSWLVSRLLIWRHSLRASSFSLLQILSARSCNLSIRTLNVSPGLLLFEAIADDWVDWQGNYSAEPNYCCLKLGTGGIYDLSEFKQGSLGSILVNYPCLHWEKGQNPGMHRVRRPFSVIQPAFAVGTYTGLPNACVQLSDQW